MNRLMILIFLVLFMMTSAGTLSADDTDLFGGVSAKVPPNVLIIFDTSFSMSDEGPLPYDSSTTYTAQDGIDSEAVYRWSVDDMDWVEMTGAVSNIGCREARQTLEEKGKYYGHVLLNESFDCCVLCSDSSSEDCEQDLDNCRVELRTGNYVNYKTVVPTDPYNTKFWMAKEVLAQVDRYGDRIYDASGNPVPGVIDKFPDVNFGLMKFNLSDGGKIVEYIGADTETLRTSIADLEINSYTPLAESLAEAGLYFAGEKSWFNNIDYADLTPISADLPCQKNYVLILTDGLPTCDGNTKFQNSDYILSNTKLLDYDEDGKGVDSVQSNFLGDSVSASENYMLVPTTYYWDNLDDVAKFLYENDIAPDVQLDPEDVVDGEDYSMQNIQTHIIAFSLGDAQVLRDAVKWAESEPLHSADDQEQLAEAFENILGGMEKTSAVFAAPVVPVDRSSKAYAGDKIYIAFFAPQADGRWFGNLKKFGIDDDGDLIDADGDKATDSDGVILSSARSYWTPAGTNDGGDVFIGGIGGVLKDSLADRNIYTYTGSAGANSNTPITDLTNSANEFSTENEKLTIEMLGVDDDETRTVLIKDIQGVEPYVQDEDDEAREWFLGDIVHSEPAVVTFDTNETEGIDSGDDTYIFVGGNDGMMHCFNDETGVEAWAFIPPVLLTGLKTFLEESTAHQYFVDGVPRVLDVGEQRILFFGLRRGGSSYYALDVTNPTKPKYLYEIAQDALGEGQTLGQSWAVPMLGTISTDIDEDGNITDTEDVIFLPGGYDVQEDNETPGTNTVGRAVFAVSASDGSVFSDFSFAYDQSTGKNTDMEYSIVDLAAVDTVGDRLINRVYAPDLGGNIFAFEDDDSNGEWEKRHLFSASSDGTQRKIFAAPDVVTINVPSTNVIGDMIFFGTGDREDLNEKNVTNRFYAVKNYWAYDGSGLPYDTHGLPLNEDDLADMTDAATYEEIQNKQQDLDEKKGWFIKLDENTGEKVLFTPIVYNGVVYFTTFTPAGNAGEDGDGKLSCTAASVYGTTYLYAVSAVNGAPAMNLCTDNDVDGSVVLNEDDRRTVLGQNIVSPPVITIRDGETTINTIMPGKSGELPPEFQFQSSQVAKRPEIHKHYWREMNEGGF